MSGNKWWSTKIGTKLLSGVLKKMVFLKVSQNSQEKTCASVA